MERTLAICAAEISRSPDERVARHPGSGSRLKCCPDVGRKRGLIRATDALAEFAEPTAAAARTRHRVGEVKPTTRGRPGFGRSGDCWLASAGGRGHLL